MSNETERLNAEIDAAKKTMETLTGLYNKVVNMMVEKYKIIDKLAEWLSVDGCPLDFENRFCKNGDTDVEEERCKSCWTKCAKFQIDRS